MRVQSTIHNPKSKYCKLNRKKKKGKRKQTYQDKYKIPLSKLNKVIIRIDASLLRWTKSNNYSNNKIKKIKIIRHRETLHYHKNK